LPEGTYEILISTATEETDQTGKSRLNFMLTVRNDVQQEHANRVLFHSIYKSKEPKPLDAQVCNYSFQSIMRIASVTKLPENKQYQNLAELLSDLVNRPAKVDVYHDEYNGKKSVKVKYWNASDKPEVHHQYKQQQKPQAQTQTAQTQPQQNAAGLPWVK